MSRIVDIDLPPNASANPSLSELGVQFREALAVALTIPSGPSWDAHQAEIDALATRIIAAPVGGFGDIAAKLRVLWCLFIDNRTEATFGAQPDSDERTQALWGLITAVERLAAGEIPLPD